MDEKRYEELDKKRFEGGLTHDEANELGRLIAEKEGKTYHSADERESADEIPEAWTAEEQAKDQVERDVPDEDADAVEVGGADPQKERALGDEREPVGPAPGGYLPPKGGQEAGAPESPEE